LRTRNRQTERKVKSEMPKIVLELSDTKFKLLDAVAAFAKLPEPTR